MDHYAGIDLGATRLRVAIADAAGTVLVRQDDPTPQGPTGEAIANAVLDKIRSGAEAVGIDPTDLAGVGIGSIGPFEAGGLAVASGLNLDGEVGRIPLRDPIAGVIDGPVKILNDAVAGAIGERSAMSDPPDNLVYLTISTGIGVGAVVDSRPLRGLDGNAGEMGHVTVDPAGRLECGCGATGHWEAYCSGRNLPAFARLLAADENTALPLDELSAVDVFAAPEDPLSTRTIAAMTEYNAIGVAATIHAFAPEVLAVGGAVALENADAVIGPLREEVPPRLAVPAPEIRRASQGEDAVLAGAIAAVRGTTGP